jgi:hypothetical protein
VKKLCSLASDVLAEPEYGDEHTIAGMLDVSVKTVRNWRITGNGPPFAKFGSAVRYRIAAAREWAIAHERRSTSDPGPVS